MDGRFSCFYRPPAVVAVLLSEHTTSLPPLSSVSAVTSWTADYLSDDDVEIPLPPILREVGAADDSDTRPAADTASALSLSAYAAADADAGEEKWNELALEQVSAQAAALRQ